MPDDGPLGDFDAIAREMGGFPAFLERPDLARGGPPVLEPHILHVEEEAEGLITLHLNGEGGSKAVYLVGREILEEAIEARRGSGGARSGR